MKKLEHAIESQQFDKETLDYLFQLAGEMKDNRTKYQLPGKILATLFYEPSTRTRLSFESAMLQLGGRVISTENAKEFSSNTKGESLEDTIKVVSGYADIVAIRHFEIGAAKRAASISSIPIVNAGDGAGQHPTQALLDLYTIQDHFDDLNGLTVAMVGDLKYGRTTRSLCYLLGRFFKVNIIFVAPPICAMNDDIKDYLDNNSVPWKEMDFEHAVELADCIYMTRVQKERFLHMENYSKAADKYRIDVDTLPLLKDNAIVMHPLPREREISPEVDDDPRMIYFEQAQNGVWVRMALIKMLLDG
ncbi:MAG: aspartate carbamoyltransferase [Proteobacteria bacterium]|nr:aspartate carbamoyltransferase [Pseudomonadota bacterium]